ncbi:MAG: type II and III secretion system protein [Acidobacteria bacterium]|nr:type II and III secretion system protein [Acidobacteriota bacterium]
MRVRLFPIVLLMCSAAALAQTQPVQATAAARELVLVAGRGELIQFATEVVRVAIAEPKIADAVVVSPRELMVNAKSVGRTTLVIWESGSEPLRYEIRVVADSTEMENLRRELREQLPGATVSVTGNEETMVLSGTAKDEEQSKKAAALVSTQTRRVVNLIRTPPLPDPRQILLQVKFATVDRVALTELGFNYFSRNDTTLGSMSTQQFQQPRFSQLQFQDQRFSDTTVSVSDFLNLFIFRPDLNIGATIRALQGRNLLQILAEPNLIAVEGKPASFLAGGQFPFPTITTTPTGGAIAPVITVQFKPFGVQLNFTPTLTDSGAIHLKVKPEVSSLDFSNAITLQGFLIPAIATRTAETEVVLKDGESFAIAGLIDNRVQQVLNKLPGFGDIPIIGHLFRSRSTRKSTDELLVVITPRFVRPLSPEEQIQLPEMPEIFLPPAAGKGRPSAQVKDPKKPEFVGPRGYQEPK